MRPDEDTAVDIVVVEDHELLAQSLTYALRAQGFDVTTCVDLAGEPIAQLVRELRPKLVLLDLDLGPHGSSLPLIDRCAQLGAQVLMLTAVTDRLRLATCIEAGAVGIVAKSQPLEQLVAAIVSVMERGSSLTDAERQEWLADLRRLRREEARRLEPFERLTERERQVLEALIDGWSPEKLAAEWFVSITTVRSQIRSILGKLGVNSQLSAVAMARRVGWSEHRARADVEG